ncbi:MAG: glycosyltransferase [Candidatus Methanomethyliaceae archaeon]
MGEKYKPLSVVICTFNRAYLLDRALASLSAQSARGQFEVIVVNNNSTDETPEIVHRWMSSIDINLVDESSQGLSYARNRGIREAKGEIIAFIDDDVVVIPNWASSILEIFQQLPEVDCLTGPVEPDWEQGEAPRWMNDELLFSVGVGNYGDKPKFLVGKEYPIGANMAFRRTVFARVGCFNTLLGRVGTTLLSYEDVEFVDRLRRMGGSVLYHPAVCARHFVPKTRTTQEYVLNRRRWDGRSAALWEWLRGGKWLLLRNALLRILFIIPINTMGWVWASLVSNCDQRFIHICRLLKAMAYLHQALHILCKVNKQ